MTVLNQREGVYSACLSVMNVESFDSACEPTKEQRSQIIAIVTEGLLQEEISMSEAARAKHDTEAKMRTYANGLVSNWLRKDLKLNGGVKYEIKNKGSRAGSSDPVVKELRKLIKTLTAGSEEHEAVSAELDKRIEAAKTAKAKTVTIDIDKIPEELKHLVNQK